MSHLENPAISNILALGVAQLQFLKAAQLLSYKSDDAAYIARKRCQFPVRVRQVGKRLVVFVSDLINYLETGENQADKSVPQIKRTFVVRTGRPSKRESLQAAAAGLTVKELRASGSKAVKAAAGGGRKKKVVLGGGAA